jgi:hypothetical protein
VGTRETLEQGDAWQADGCAILSPTNVGWQIAYIIVNR